MPTFTITVTPPEAARAANAFGRYWSLGRPATADEIKAYLIRQLQALVRQQERGQAEAAVVARSDLVAS